MRACVESKKTFHMDCAKCVVITLIHDTELCNGNKANTKLIIDLDKCIVSSYLVLSWMNSGNTNRRKQFVDGQFMQVVVQFIA